MYNTKFLADMLKVCSVLPAILVLPATADLPNVSGNAWVFGDLNLGYEIANNSAIGGRVSVVNGVRGNDFPKYNVLGRSVNLTGTPDNRTNVYVGPVNLTLRELQKDEAFVYNWQVGSTTGDTNWEGKDLADGEISYADIDIAQQNGIVWGDGAQAIMEKNGWPWTSNYPIMAKGIEVFANRDATKNAGVLATNNADLTIDGATVHATKVDMVASVMNIVANAVPANILNGQYNASDGKTKIIADNFSVTDNSRIIVGAGAELDITESDKVVFENNVLTGNKDGAAINVVTNGVLKIDGATFAKNDSHDGGGFGGAIWNSGTATIKNAEFHDNIATSGGAVGGSKFSTGLLTVEGGNFDNNHAKGDGGAIAAFKSLSIIDSQFENNTAMYDKNKDGEWVVAMPTDNDPMGGGALALGAESETAITSIKKAIFKNNASGYNGGAIGTRLAQNTTNEKYNANSGKLDIAATFTNNFAENDGGAIYNTFYNDNDAGNGDGVTVTGVFEENRAGHWGGAIFNDGRKDVNNGGGVMTVYGVIIKDNEAGESGGAIYNTGVLTVKGGTFNDNEAGKWAGAIYNAVQVDDRERATDAIVNIQDVSFVDNEAVYGGAIYNEAGGTITLGGKNSFVDNVAASQGGAIYNQAGGTVVLGGTNVFNHNFVGSRKATNDIYNDGALNLVAGGKTTINGGIRGSGTLTLEKDAVLNIGTSAIIQDVFNINGTVVAAIINKDSFGRLQGGDVIVGEDAKLELSVGAVGTYDIFGGQFVDVVVGDAYVATATKDGIVIKTKAVEDLAKDTGLTTQAAGMVAGLANSSDKAVQKISLMVQQAINGGDIELVERESAKMNPDSKPVAQSVTTSVQNQVMSLTAGRMSSNVGGTRVGRAGGSKSQGSGFWMQGLFNKSKYANQFHGYTRGFALGGDTIVNRAFTLGGGFAYNNTDVHADSGRYTSVESNTLFMYAQYKPNKWYANATLTYSMADYSEEAFVFGVKSLNPYSVDTYGAQLMTGFDFASGVSTEIGARYMHVMQDAYTNVFGAQVQELNTDFVSGVAGLRYAFEIHNSVALKLRPELRAAITYDFISDESMTTVVMSDSVSYQVAGERLSRVGGEFGIGLVANYKGMELSVLYDLDLHESYTSHTGMFKFRGRF